MSFSCFAHEIYNSGDELKKVDCGWDRCKTVTTDQVKTELESKGYTAVSCSMYDIYGLTYGIRCFGEYREVALDTCSFLNNQLLSNELDEVVLMNLIEIANCDE